MGIYYKVVFKTTAAYVQLFNYFFFWCGFSISAAFIRGRLMQCSESAKPVKAVQHDVTCTMKANFDSVNVIKLFQIVNKHFWLAKSGRI